MITDQNGAAALGAVDPAGVTLRLRSGDETGWAGRCRTTCWSAVLAAAAGGPSARVAMSRLYRAYWYPLFAVVARARGREAAAELTHEFIVTRLLESGDLKRVTQRPGERFRGWLFTALRSFLKNEWKHRHRQCRDERKTVAFTGDTDDEHGPRLSALADSQPNPEQLLARAQALSLLSGVLRRLRREYCISASAAGVNGEARFDAVKAFLPGPDTEAADYRDVAATLGLRSDAVRQLVRRLRLRFGLLLKEELAKRVTGDGDVATAQRLLCQALSSSPPAASSDAAPRAGTVHVEV